MRWLLLLLFATGVGCGGQAERDGSNAGTPDAQATGGGPATDASYVDASDAQSDAAGDAPNDAPEDALDLAALQAACAKYSTAWCKTYEFCAPAIADFIGVGPECEARQAKDCIAGGIATDSTRTPPAIEDCAQLMASQSCDKLFWGGGLPCLPGGLRPGAAACAVDAQCESGLCNAIDAACGTCQATLGLGKPCDGTIGWCSSALGLRCENGVCKKTGFDGDACGPKLACHSFFECMNGVCTKPTGGPGDACTQPSCDPMKGSFSCVNGVCSSTSVASLGEPCPYSYPDGTYCEYGAFCQKGVCVASPKEGQACSPYAPPCSLPLRCVGGVCQMPDPTQCP